VAWIDERVIEVSFLVGSRDFSLLQGFRPNLRPIQPPVQLVSRAFSARLMQVECEADHPHSCSAKVPLSARLCGYVMLKTINPQEEGTKICNECKGHLCRLFVNEVLWRKRKVNTSSSGQDVV